jgi:hypothetical protein
MMTSCDMHGVRLMRKPVCDVPLWSAGQIRSAQSVAFEPMRGAGVVAPELAKLEQQREQLGYDREENVITFLPESGKLRTGLSYQTARDVFFWMLTGGMDIECWYGREGGPHNGIRSGWPILSCTYYSPLKKLPTKDYSAPAQEGRGRRARTRGILPDRESG